MKRTLTALLSALLILSLAACENRADNDPPAPEASQEAVTPALSTDPAPTPSADPEPAPGESDTPSQTGGEGEGNILIAYFGIPETDGTDTVAGASRVSTPEGVVGNTQFIAQAIQEAVGGELYAIETVQEYPGLHDPLVDQADEEQEDDARPELSTAPENVDAYDVIFLGYPNWWGDMPMPLYTFLESYDFSGKTIIPFVTHGGSSFSRNSVPNAAQDAKDWAVNILN